MKMIDQATEAAFAAAAVKLAGDFVQGLVKRAGSAIGTSIVPHLKGFEAYFAATYKRCNTVKLIVDRDQLHRLTDIYVKGNYRHGQQVVNDDALVDLLRQNSRVVVQGLGGIGKTILLKYIWLTIFQESGGRLPVFVELRRLNEFQAPDLLSYVRSSLTPSGSPLTGDQFETLLKSGRFIFLFDAFDELSEGARESVERQILDLAYRYQKCGILLSSRHDSRFGAWENFAVYQAAPFTKDQIEEVIEKVPFDERVKLKFLNEVIKKKFPTYESFLSSPLLAIMMLITYEQFADIPEKRHIFYKYAFQTLYTLHDAGKETFRRDRKSGLNEDDFCKVFSTFCLASYVQREFAFTKAQARSALTLAAKRSNITIDAGKLLSEICESVNLLYEEGDVVSFTHRSFQEYFSAYALTGQLSSSFGDIAWKIPVAPNDNVFPMTYDMNPDLVEEEFLIPGWDKFAADLGVLLGRGGDLEGVLRNMMVSMITFPGRTRKDVTRIMLEFFFEGGVVDYLRRALAFLPGHSAIEWAGPRFSNTSSREIGLFLRELAKIVGMGSDVSKYLCHLEFASETVHFTLRPGDETKGRVTDLLSRALANPTVKKALEEEATYGRALATAVDIEMKKVRQRSKARAKTLDELLSSAE